MISVPNYKISEQIHKSKNSVLYRGIRESDGQSVVLKLLQKEFPKPQDLARFSREFKIIKNLELDGCIQAYDLENYKNVLILVMEDFQADNLKTLMGPNRLDLNDFFFDCHQSNRYFRAGASEKNDAQRYQTLEYSGIANGPRS